MRPPVASLPYIPLALLVTGLLSCKEAASPPLHRLPMVEVADVVKNDVPIYSEAAGTIDGMVKAVMRPRSAGILDEAELR